VKTKLEIFRYSIAPKLGDRVIYEVSEKDLIDLVEIKGRTAKVQANRLAAELKVFFGWASSLMGSVVDLKVNPALRLSDLHHPEKPKARVLSRQELGWFLEAIVPEPYQFQRGFLLLLLTATRLSEVTQAKSDEFSSGMWTIPAGRTKNSLEHKIALGPWARRLVHSNHEWLFPSARREGAKSNSIWWESRRRIHSRMEKIAGIQLEPFTPHDLRRTVRSNTKRLGIDFETAEAMLNHSKKGLERIYDRYELEEEKRISFLKWENEIISIARSVGVEEALNVPTY
jgi:integrase